MNQVFFFSENLTAKLQQFEVTCIISMVGPTKNVYFSFLLKYWWKTNLEFLAMTISFLNYLKVHNILTIEK